MFMMKRLILLAFSLVFALTLSACNSGETPDTDQPVYRPPTTVHTPINDEEAKPLLDKFLAEYEKILSAPAYFKEYSLSTTLDSDPLSDGSLGYFMVKGDAFFVEWYDYSDFGEVKSTYIYQDRTLYADANGSESWDSMDAATANATLESLGIVYRQLELSDFAEKTVSKKNDGTYVVFITLTPEAQQRISDAALAECAELSSQRTFRGVSLSLAFSEDGTPLRSQLITNVDIVQDGVVRDYRVEAYLKYTSFDASTITIELPERIPEPDAPSSDMNDSIPTVEGN